MKFLKLFLIFVFLFCLNSCNKISKKENDFKFYKIKEEKEYYTGTIKSLNKSDLAFQLSGQIIYLPFSKGDFAKKGEILAKIDNTIYKIQKQEEEVRLKEYQIKYNQSEKYYKRMNLLHSSGAVSDNDWEDAGFKVETNSKEIAIQKEKINYLERQLAFSKLKAPYDCYIFEKSANIGDIANVGEKILTVINSNNNQIEIIVPSDKVNLIKLKSKVKIKSNFGEFSGHIEHISHSSFDVGGYVVKILPDKFYPELREGMSVEVEISQLNSNEIYIPLIALIENKQVFKLEGNKLKKVNIETGQIKKEKVEVLKGLKQDDIILLKGLNYAKNNQYINTDNISF